MNSDPTELARHACRRNDLAPSQLKLLRSGENTLFLLPEGIVLRVSRPGQIQAAHKELAVARWLNQSGIPAVKPKSDLATLIVELDGCAITFWEQLPQHSPCSPRELATALRTIHALAPPAEFTLPPVEPFVRLGQRLASSRCINEDDRSWLLQHLADLQSRYTAAELHTVGKVLHGDAWDHNIVATSRGPIVLDLERFAIGPVAWDLSLSAVDHQTFATLSTSAWQEFCTAYGHDITTWEHYPLFRDIRELRKTTFALQIADEQLQHVEQARFRVACLRGLHGSRPWHWHAVP
ncbi:aminoglycoside phosphotransferase [Longispora fulva]|uniref:Aminoglycoside phosphotransferase (APT) family kinase protein n=1 Tax=Longispora fulva TaxID=619741 RepID=A0A8J7G977_9ACTN|nr:aminoglycoside phosphotransferase family protein [Longispora fulva]MBG6133974.1 aminoglycoside phosphotransferase (APT) family kinase protein [Longispora fulva]GIG63599.1 aminoglycoside phosphotransferase [Longispora fulva]